MSQRVFYHARPLRHRAQTRGLRVPCVPREYTRVTREHVRFSITRDPAFLLSIAQRFSLSHFSPQTSGFTTFPSL